MTQGGKVIGILAGHPKDPLYLQSTEVVFNMMSREGEAAGFHPPEPAHHHGQFVAVNIGITHNRGTLCPTYLNGKVYKEAVDWLLALQQLQQMANFASGGSLNCFL